MSVFSKYVVARFSAQYKNSYCSIFFYLDYGWLFYGHENLNFVPIRSLSASAYWGISNTRSVGARMKKSVGVKRRKRKRKVRDRRVGKGGGRHCRLPNSATCSAECAISISRRVMLIL